MEKPKADTGSPEPRKQRQISRWGTEGKVVNGKSVRDQILEHGMRRTIWQCVGKHERLKYSLIADEMGAQVSFELRLGGRGWRMG